MTSLHRRIRASAGTGKTFRLTDRILELLLLGAEPGRLIALTFTRKAAGEFLTKTLLKLAACAAGEADAAAFCARRGLPRRPAADFLVLLKKVTESLDRIEFGTLDSFFFRILAAFAPDLRLGRALRLAPESSDGTNDVSIRRELARELDAGELVADLLRLPGKAKLDPLGTDFGLIQVIESLHTLYPDPAAWGVPETIWPSGCPWLDFENAAEPDTGEIRQVVLDALVDLENLPFGGKMKAFASRLLEKAPALLADEPVTIFFRKDIELTRAERAAARYAIGRNMGRVLKNRLAQARRWHGIGVVLRGIRDRRMREGLRFADLPVLVQRLAKSDELQFRLDGWFDHWLIDEFQDTSRIQWRALQPLVDEVLQDASGTRSFFYVGDVKQSIYRFRDGDPTLFDEIFDHYTRHAPGHIVDEELGESRRSAAEVIDVIQKTFSPAALESKVDPAVLDRWRAAWTDHSAHPSNVRPGFSVCLRDHPDTYWDHIARIVGESRLLESDNLSCAVLVRRNDDARVAVRELALRNIAATTESSPRVAASSPAGVAILMATRWVADPSDALARRALAFGPLAPERTDFVEASLEAFHLRGAAGMVGDWLAVLSARRAALDPASALAIRRAAREFDGQNSASPRAFAEFFETFASPASARPGTVQVMTIHKSKGLEYDLVFVPVLSDTRIDERSGGETFCGDERNLGPGTRPWILSLPSEVVCEADPVLQSAGAALRERTAFDNLCALYVAETRAKRALVLLLPTPSAT